MRNTNIDDAINQVVDGMEANGAFKSTFKQFIKNKFDNKSTDNDLKNILELLDVKEEK